MGPARTAPSHLIRQTPGRGLQAHDLHAPTAYHVRKKDWLLKDEESVIENPNSGTDPGNVNVLLPPSSSKISAQILHDTATITIVHSFENNLAAHLEQARYQFPLPHSAAVVDFACCIGDSPVLRGTVKPKDEAKRAFHNAVRRHRPAGLLEQDGSPEIFKMSIGNIEVGAKARTELTIILLLKHDFIPANSVTQPTLSIPMYIAPRYGPAPTAILETGPRGPETNFSVHIDVLSAEDIIDIHSDTHQVHYERGAGRRKCQRWAEFLAPQKSNESTSAMVRLAQDIACLDKDFVLSVVTRPNHGTEGAIACLETHPSLANHGTLMITLPPKFMLQSTTPITDSEIVFLADRSGSMSDKIDGLKSAMEFFIRGIPEGRLFNIWCFGSSYTSLWTRSRAFSQDTMTEALRYVSNGFNADMGGTELLTAIQAVVDVRDKTKAMDLVVLTDGEVWSLEDTISFVRSSTSSGDKPVRYFALGIGNAVSRALVEGIAEAGGGYAEIIPNATGGHWEDRLVAVLSAALTGHCGRISVELDTLPQEATGKQTGKSLAVQTSPADLSVLSPFVRSRIFYLFEGGLPESCRSVIVNATDVNGSKVQTAIPVLSLHDKDLKLHRFAAHALLRDLEHRHHEIRNPKKRYGYHYSPSTSSQDLLMLKKEGERLGCKWSLASKWTSFVALEQEEEIKHKATTADYTSETTGKEVVMATTTPKDDLGLLRPRNPEKQRLLLAPTNIWRSGDSVADSGQGTHSIGPLSDEEKKKVSIANESDDALGSEESDSDDDESAGIIHILGGSPKGGNIRRTQTSCITVSGMLASVSPDSRDCDSARIMSTPLYMLQSAAPPPQQSSALWTKNIVHERRHADHFRSRKPLVPYGDRPAGRSGAGNVVPSRVPGNPRTDQRKGSRNTRFFSKIFGLFSSKGPSGPSRDSIDFNREESSRSISPGVAETSSPVVSKVTATNSKAADSTTTEAVARAAVETKLAKMDEAPPVELLPPPSSQEVKPAPREKKENMAVMDTKSLSLPASTTVADIAAGKAFVKKIVKYQQSSGSFVFSSDDELKAVLGDDFYSKVTNDMRDVPQIIAVTALLLALLEAQFESCKGLWVLVAAKAKRFVESQVDELKLKGATTPAEVLAKAQRAALQMGVLDLEEDGSLRVRRDSAEPIELLFAPAV